MAESKFLKYQDKDGNHLIDVCDEVIEVQEAACEESPCFPNATALVPNWQVRKDLSPFLNEKICHYQVPVETPYTTTIEERLLEDSNLTEALADDSLNERFKEYLEEAVTAFIETYNKDDSESSKNILRDAIIWDVATDYFLEPRAMSRLRLLYSVPYEVLVNLDDALPDTEATDPLGGEVTYEISDLKVQLIHVRKGLKLYSWYNKVRMKMEGANFYHLSGTDLEGVVFDPGLYGDWGVVKGSVMADILPELDHFLNIKGYNIAGVGKFGGFRKDKVVKVVFEFSEEYELLKLTIYTDGCSETPIFFSGDKLNYLKASSAWKDPTAMAYLAQLDDMITDLTAREPVPWVEFIKKYTYPPVESIINQGYLNTNPQNLAVSCMADALAQEGKQLGEDILDEVFSLGDAIAAQFHKNLCSESPDKVLDDWKKMGIIYDPNEPGNLDKTIWSMALEQANQSLNNETQTPERICAQLSEAESLSEVDDLWKEILNELKFCGMSDLLMSAIQCLFGGLTFEQAMATVIESALRAMSLENFDKLFVGLPPEKQAELEALAKKKLESGDIFKESSTLQQTSDALEGKLDIEKLWNKEGLSEEQAKLGKVYTAGDVTAQIMVGDPEYDELSATDASRRTLAKQYDFTDPSQSGASNNVLMEAWIQAYLELFSENYLELLDHLNKFPGAAIVAYTIAMLDCPQPPVTNPSMMDFIKDTGSPDCRNTFNIIFPPIKNPFGWLPARKDFTKLLFDTAMYVIQQMLRDILVMVMMKVCEVIGNAACGALGASGAALAALASGGRTKITDAIRDSICGDDVDQEQLDDTVTDMLSTLGLGAAALADTDQVLNFAGDISSAVTTEELYSAFLCEPSQEFLSIVRQIIKYEYPDFEAALRNDETVKSFFCNMGNLMPATYKDSMGNFLEEYPVEAAQTSCINICATPEEIEEFCQLRTDILGGRASPAQIQQLCEPNNDLKDLADVAQGGLPTLPPIVSDPGCDNGILPYEPDEAIAVASVVLNDMLEQLKVDFTYDMLGNGPFKKKWGLINMVLSDTMGKPLTTHFRRSFNRRTYVDFYMDQGGLDDLTKPGDTWSLKDIGDAVFQDPSLVKRQKGAFPTKIADWLESYLQSDSFEINFHSNNEFLESIPYEKTLEEAGVTAFLPPAASLVPGIPPLPFSRGGIELTRLDETVLGYNTSIEVDLNMIRYTEEARKKESDIKLYFQDNCKGLQADPDSPMEGDAYSSAFNLELYLSELVSDDGSASLARNLGTQPAQPWAITSTDDDHSHTYSFFDEEENGITSYTDGHEHEIKLGVVQEADGHIHTLRGVRFSPEFTSSPLDTSRIKITEILNARADINTTFASMVPVTRTAMGTLRGEIQEGLTPKNSDAPADEGGPVPVDNVKYEFLSIDNTLDGINFDDYPNFVSTFSSKQDYLPQIVLLREMIEQDGAVINALDLKDSYDAIMEVLLKNFIDEVANNAESFEYGAVFDDLSYDDVEYVISYDIVGVDALGREYTYEAGTSYYDVKLDVPLLDPLRIIFKDGSRPILPKDQIMGMSRMQYEIDHGTRTGENRVFYLDPLTYGGSYMNPPIHIKPLQNKGWLGFVDVMFPEISPCKPYATDLIDFEDIQKKMDDAYPNIPEDPRLRDDEDCAIEVPYNRILDRIAAAGLEGLIAAAIRIYVSTNFIKSMSTFTKFNPNFPDVFSSSYASYIVEEMRTSFKEPVGIFEGPFKDSEFWYAFLEQAVQLYGRRVDSGDIFEPPESVIEALNRLNDVQESYVYPDKEELKEERGQMAGLFETLKSYRKSKNYEAIQATEQDAKLILKEMVMEQLNYMGEKFVKNLEIVGMAPNIYDLDYYLLQYLSQGGEGLTLDQEIVETYIDLPTIPYEVNEEAEGPYYTYGGSFASPDGSEYVGYYHVTTDEESGLPVYMSGEFHSDAEHDVLTPFANEIEVNIGDIASYQVHHSSIWEQPFVIEKYIRIDGVIHPVSETTLNIIKTAGTADQNISDIYPGDLELVTDVNGQVVGLTGELGVRYGLRFSIIINGNSYKITEVEVDSLDLKLSQVDPFGGDSKLLLCLINMLKEDEKFRLVAHYIFPLSKLTSLMAIYNGEAFLPSIGEKVVPLGDVGSSTMSEKPGMSISFNDDGSWAYGQTEAKAIAAALEETIISLFAEEGWAYDPDDGLRTRGEIPSLFGDYMDTTTISDLISKVASGELTDFENSYVIALFDLEDETLVDEVKTPLSDLISDPATMTSGWAHKVDRDAGFPNPFILEWDDWDQVLLRNSKTRIKKIFKSYYNSRNWSPGAEDESFGGPGDRPGVIITREFREKFKTASGAHLLPWWKRRMLRTNPFNENGELCESSD